jgi:phage terminase large subunit-like protein
LRAGFSESFVKAFRRVWPGFSEHVPGTPRSRTDIDRGQSRARGHPVLAMNVANTVITLDDAGNRKPNKRKSTGRIDGLVALAMALGVAPLQSAAIKVPCHYRIDTNQQLNFLPYQKPFLNAGRPFLILN